MSDTADIEAMADLLEQKVAEKYNVPPEHLWETHPDSVVFRHHAERQEKGAWFLLVTDTEYGKLGIDVPGKAPDETQKGVFVAVMKEDPEVIDQLLSKPGYARGYHMNKVHWLSIVLDGTVPLEEVMLHVSHSFELTASHAK